MASGPKGLRHALLGARKNVTAGARGATSEHQLSSELVIHSNERMVVTELTPTSERRDFEMMFS